MAERGDIPNKTQLDQKLDRDAEAKAVQREKYERKGDKGQLIADAQMRLPESGEAKLSWSIAEIERSLNTSVFKPTRTTLDVFGRALNQKSDMRLRTLSEQLETRMASQFKAQLDTGAKPAKLTAFDLKSQSLRMIATNASLGAYQFQKTQQLPYMRKSLALGYKHVSILKSISSGITSMEKALVSKLEAIKINTAASVPRKQSYFKKLWADVSFLNRRRIAGNISNFVMDGQDRVYKKYALPALNGIHDALTDTSQGGGINAVRRKATGKLNTLRRTARAVEQSADPTTKLGKLKQVGARSVAGIAGTFMRGGQKFRMTEQASHKVGDLLKPITGISTRFNPFSANGYGDVDWNGSPSLDPSKSRKGTANDNLLSSFNDWREEYRGDTKESLSYLRMIAEGGGPTKPGRPSRRKISKGTSQLKVSSSARPVDDEDYRGYTPSAIVMAEQAAGMMMSGQTAQQLRSTLQGTPKSTSTLDKLRDKSRKGRKSIRGRLRGAFDNMVNALEEAGSDQQSPEAEVTVNGEQDRNKSRRRSKAARRLTIGKARLKRRIATAEKKRAAYTSQKATDGLVENKAPDVNGWVAKKLQSLKSVELERQNAQANIVPNGRFSAISGMLRSKVNPEHATKPIHDKDIDNHGLIQSLQRNLDKTRASSDIDRSFIEKMIGKVSANLGTVTHAVEQGNHERGFFEKLQMKWKALREKKEEKANHKNAIHDIDAENKKRRENAKTGWAGFKEKGGHLIRGVGANLAQGNLFGAASDAGSDLLGSATDWATDEAGDFIKKKGGRMMRRGRVRLRRGARGLKGKLLSRFGRTAATEVVEDVAGAATRGSGKNLMRGAGRLTARALKGGGKGLISGISGGMTLLTKGAEAGIPMLAKGAIGATKLAGKGALKVVTKGVPLAAKGAWGATKLATKGAIVAAPLAGKGALGAAKLTGKLGLGVAKGTAKAAGILGKSGGGLLLKGAKTLGKGGIAGIATGIAADYAHDWFDKNTTGGTRRAGKTAATAASWGATGAMIGSVIPVVGTLAGAAIGAGLGALYENIDVISNGISAAGSFVMSGVTAAGRGIGKAGSAVWTGLFGKDAKLDKNGKVINREKHSVMTNIRAVLFGRDAKYTKDGQLLSAGVQGLAGTIQRGVYQQIFGDADFSIGKSIMDKGKSIMSSFKESLSGTWDSAKNAAGNAASAVTGAVGDAASSAGAAIGETYQRGKDAVVSAGEAVGNTIFKLSGNIRENFKMILNKAIALGDPHPEITAAQWALESAYGKRMAGQNNPFGQKAKAGESHTVVMTHEDGPGGMVRQAAKFKNYNSVDEAIKEHIVKWTGRKTKPGSTPIEAAQALKSAGYATDRNYVKKLGQILAANNIDPNKVYKAGSYTPSKSAQSGQNTVPKKAASAIASTTPRKSLIIKQGVKKVVGGDAKTASMVGVTAANFNPVKPAAKAPSKAKTVPGKAVAKSPNPPVVAKATPVANKTPPSPVAPVKVASSPVAVSGPTKVNPRDVISGTSTPMTTPQVVSVDAIKPTPQQGVMSNTSKELQALMKTLAAQTEATRQNTQALLGHGSKLDSMQNTPSAPVPAGNTTTTQVVPLISRAKPSTPSTNIGMSMRKTSVSGG